MIRFVFLDLDETLLDFHKAEALALRGTLKAQGLEPTDQVVARYSAINQSQWELLELGRLTRDQVLHRRFELLFEEFGIQKDSRETKQIYEKLLSQGHYFLPGAEELLKTLYGKYDLYLMSNGTAVVQDGRLKSANISHYFRQIFISERIGFNKPAKAFFDQCFAQIPNFRKEEAIILGDSLTSDIRGGNNAGILTCWFNPKGAPRREDIRVDYEIKALAEFPKLLETL